MVMHPVSVTRWTAGGHWSTMTPLAGPATAFLDTGTTMAQFTNPFFIAVMICWILSVCVHEFAHALVAYLGGDKSVVAKGYLHFNIFAYIHPVTSILLPALFLFMGGVPLPGGAVYIDDRALRSPAWRSAVSAAGS